jgi:hypothetical protein
VPVKELTQKILDNEMQEYTIIYTLAVLPGMRFGGQMPFISPILRDFSCWWVRWGIGLCEEGILTGEKSEKAENFLRKSVTNLAVGAHK